MKDAQLLTPSVFSYLKLLLAEAIKCADSSHTTYHHILLRHGRGDSLVIQNFKATLQ